MLRKIFASRKTAARIVVITLSQAFLCNMLCAQTGTQKGAVLGGVGGAVIGGIIGHQNDETPEGALIGGAVGAIAGGVIGNQRDKQLARERYYQQQAWQAQQQRRYHTYHTVPSSRPVVVSPGLTSNDVLSMTRSGVSESIIVNHIYSNGVQRRLQTNEVTSLFQQGVSENIINAMQQAPVRGYTTSSVPQSSVIVTQPSTTTVIVEEPSYVSPPPVMPAPSYYTPRNYSARRGF